MTQLSISPGDLSLYSQYRKPEISSLYELSPELMGAVEVAIALNQPLLLTGEPGTGKTSLAEKVAADLHIISNGLFRREPYRFYAKSNSTFTDLFYNYDAIGHFYDANLKKEFKPQLKDYIQLNALGSAIAAGMEPAERSQIPARNLPGSSEPRNSVVLIDEIDKAPRDFPNDLLHELENYSFSIRESGLTQYTKRPENAILVILTSNGEKEFPAAFLRRCIYFKIEFPSNDLLKKILENHRLAIQSPDVQDLLIGKFLEIRAVCKNKKPSTAELVSWVRLLMQKNIDFRNSKVLLATLPVLVKDSEDAKDVQKKWIL